MIIATSVWQCQLFRIIALGVITSYIATFLSTTRLHRGQAHQAVVFVHWLDVLMRLGLWMLVGVNRQEWVAVHRKHHIFVDTVRDPHSPLQYGRLKVFLFTAVYYQRALKSPEFKISDYSLSIDDAVDRWDAVFADGFRGLGLTAGLVTVLSIVVDGMSAVTLLVPLVWLMIHYAVYLFKGGLTNSDGHRRTEKAARDAGWNSVAGVSQNRLLTSWLTVGEAGDHLAHHLNPHSVFIGRWYGDPGGMFIWWTIRLGLAAQPGTRELTIAEMAAADQHESNPDPSGAASRAGSG